MSDLAPIVLFTYNRPWHTEQTLSALMKNDLAKDSILYIFSDGSKDASDDNLMAQIAEVRDVIKKKNGARKFILSNRKRIKV